MKALLDARFGTWRGLARLLLAYSELATGRLWRFRLREPRAVRRVVFVCLGNICRSAHGEQVAREFGLAATSLGLSTTTGAASPEQAVAAAGRQGVSLARHRARDWKDYVPQPGDLLLAMEVRQAHELRRRLGPRRDVQVALLGLWCRPPLPHLHDPFTLGDAYFDTCFARVRQALARLARAVPNAASDMQAGEDATTEAR